MNSSDRYRRYAKLIKIFNGIDPDDVGDILRADGGQLLGCPGQPRFIRRIEVKPPDDRMDRYRRYGPLDMLERIDDAGM